MAKIKHTKNELKAQSDALKRFLRFLPMLQLKKQQLQMEIASISQRLEHVRERERQRRAGMSAWVGLFASDEVPADLVTLLRTVTDVGNIAGVPIPIYRAIETQFTALDPFLSPSWLDEAQDAVEALLAMRAEAAVLERQRELITEELRTTSQRVNLFEKVKIPECRENIREIRIFLGDQQTAAVARGKIAKGHGSSKETAA